VAAAPTVLKFLAPDVGGSEPFFDAIAGGLKSWRYWTGRSDEEKEAGTVGARELCRNARKSPTGARLEGVAPTFHGYWYDSGEALPNTKSQSRRFAVYCPKPGSQNGNRG
jgi:hypothetical protein